MKIHPILPQHELQLENQQLYLPGIFRHSHPELGHPWPFPGVLISLSSTFSEHRVLELHVCGFFHLVLEAPGGSGMGESGVAPDEPEETQVENPTESWDSAEKDRADMVWSVALERLVLSSPGTHSHLLGNCSSRMNHLAHRKPPHS